MCFERLLQAFARWQPGNLFDIAAQPTLEYRELIVIHNCPCEHSSKLQLSIRFTPSRCLDVRQDWYPMYYPGGIKARVSPVQSIEPHSILAPTRDLNREPLGPQSRVVTTILLLHTWVQQFTAICGCTTRENYNLLTVYQILIVCCNTAADTDGRFQDDDLRWCQTRPHWGTSSEFQQGEIRENRSKPAITSFCILRHFIVILLSFYCHFIAYYVICILRHFAYSLRHNIAFLPVETRNSCLSEAASGITFIPRIS